MYPLAAISTNQRKTVWQKCIYFWRLCLWLSLRLSSPDLCVCQSVSAYCITDLICDRQIFSCTLKWWYKSSKGQSLYRQVTGCRHKSSKDHSIHRKVTGSRHQSSKGHNMYRQVTICLFNTYYEHLQPTSMSERKVIVNVK